MRPLRWLLLSLLVLAALWLLVGVYAAERVLDAYFGLQRGQAGAVERTTQVDEHRWVWLEAGEGPPIVLLHGFTGMKENWLPLMQALAPQYRVIAPDLAGWNDSSRAPGADYGYAAQALRVNAFTAALGLRGYALVGHSMGGGIAAVAAAQHPQGLDTLVLMSAAGVPFDANPFANAVQAGGHPFSVSTRTEFDRYLALVFNDPPWVPWPLDRALIAQRRADVEFEKRVLDRVGRGGDTFVPQRAASAIFVPTLLLWCEGDRIIDASAADAWAARITRPPLMRVTLDDCNHMPMLERTEAVAEALRDFLRAHGSAP